MLHATGTARDLDIKLIQIAQGHRSANLDTIAIFLAVAGGPFFSLLLLGMLSLLLLIQGRFGECLLVLMVFAVLSGFEIVAKLNIDHPRPGPEFVRDIPAKTYLKDIPDFTVQSRNSFPSGLAMRAVYLMGILGMLLCPGAGDPYTRYGEESHSRHLWCMRLVSAAVVAYAGFAGYSRLYLGAHWPSDVLAGYLLGALGLLVFLRGKSLFSIR